MAHSSSTLIFKVTRQKPELIPPAKPTPHEFKPLSDIDDQEGVRFQIPVIQFYQKNPVSQGKDPVNIIRDAIAKALVFYYPFAGRLRECSTKKLIVECTGEGIMFIEADADVTLEEFSDADALQPPFPCFDELLFDVPGSSGILDCPLMLIQVTRLKCGGFIFALRLNHTMSDAPGLIQFMSSVAEIAQGAEVPSIHPVWDRELIIAQNPPHVAYTHQEYDDISDITETVIPVGGMVQRSFFFGNDEISALRRNLPIHLQSCTDIELLIACTWRCRTIAMSYNPQEEVRVLCVVNARKRFNPPLPVGYYGNVIASRVVISNVDDICKKPLGYALELVMNTKLTVTENHIKSIANLMLIKGRPLITIVRTYLVSDVTRLGFADVDFGWGKAIYGGPASIGIGPVPGIASFCIPFKNKKGDNGILIPVCLPLDAMDTFVKELEMLKRKGDPRRQKLISSAL